MRKNLDGERLFKEAASIRGIEVRGMFLAMRKKALVGCLKCGHEWEVEPRDLVRATGNGCRMCAIDASRKPNEVLAEIDEYLVLKCQNKQWPEGVMLINRKKWELLQREKIGHVLLCKKGYPKAVYKGKIEFVHRILMGFPQAPEQVDHVNGVKHDNRLCNLRIVTDRENQMNRSFRKTNKSGVIGVSSFKYGWEAKLCVGSKVVHKSRHKTLEAAAEARAKAVREHCGEFAPQETAVLPQRVLDAIHDKLCRERGSPVGEELYYEGRPVYALRQPKTD